VFLDGFFFGWFFRVEREKKNKEKVEKLSAAFCECACAKASNRIEGKKWLKSKEHSLMLFRFGVLPPHFSFCCLIYFS
jgi:hypothetical protein